LAADPRNGRSLFDHHAQAVKQVKLSIIVAVYNEVSTVGTLLERVWAQPVPDLQKEIVIVESNSTDGSRASVADFAARHAAEPHTPILVLHQDAPRGKGNAIRQGLAAATGDIILIQDADLEYDVGDYPDLLRPIIDGRSAFVLGSRHMGPNGWKIRKFAHGGPRAALMNVGGILFHGLFNALYRTQLSDPTTMYKVFRTDCLQGIALTRDRFDFDFELLAKLIRRGFRPLEVPVSYQSRGFDEGKKIRLLRDPLTWVRAIVTERFAAVPAQRAPTTERNRQPAHRHGTF
jgi:glycosyltransferase involved in cell wall biosynthesis